MKNKTPIIFFFLFSIISYSQINLEKKLKELYLSKNSSQEKSTKYLNTLYNISVLEILLNDYDSAEISLIELIKYSPKNYSAISKLILLYMKKGEYQKASPYRKKINKGINSKEIHNYYQSEKNLKKLIEIAPLDFDTYEALIQLYNKKLDYKKAKPLIDKLHETYKLGIFKTTSKDDFCIEQFEWKNYEISVHEKFFVENKPSEKHLFYIFDKNDKDPNVKIIIGTEKKTNKNVYDLYLYKNGSYKYLNYNLKITYNYPELKEKVIQVLKEKLKKE